MYKSIYLDDVISLYLHGYESLMGADCEMLLMKRIYRRFIEKHFSNTLEVVSIALSSLQIHQAASLLENPAEKQGGREKVRRGEILIGDSALLYLLKNVAKVLGPLITACC